MLFCKKCGHAVIEGARFCEKCSSRLDIEGNVLSGAEITQQTEREEFNPDRFVCDNTLLTNQVFGYRIIDKKYRVLGDVYYLGAKKEDEVSQALIRHSVFPNFTLYNYFNAKFSFQENLADDTISGSVNRLKDKLNDYKIKCKDANVSCIFERMEAYYSENEKIYHLLFQLKDVTPILEYIKNANMTVRECVKFTMDILEQLSHLHKYKYHHGEVSLDNIFIDNLGRAVLGLPDRSVLFENMGYADEVCQYREQFVPTDLAYNKLTTDIYAVGNILYLMLNAFKPVFLNVYQKNHTLDDYLTAEAKRKEMLDPPHPFFAQNALGSAIVRACVSEATRIKTTDEFYRLLENSLNYLPAAELDKTCIEYEKLKKGILWEANSRTSADEEVQMPVDVDQIKTVQSKEKEIADEPKRKTGVYVLIIVCALLVVSMLFLYMVERKKDRSYKSISNDEVMSISHIDDMDDNKYIR